MFLLDLLFQESIQKNKLVLIPFVKWKQTNLSRKVREIIEIHVSDKLGNPILRRHRAWLEDFKLKMREKREVEEIKDRTEKERFERVINR